jgi:transposase
MRDHQTVREKAVYPLGSPSPRGGDPAQKRDPATPQEITEQGVPSSRIWEGRAAVVRERVQKIVNGAPNAEVSWTDVKQVLGPTVVPGDLVVMDNLSAHNATRVRQALARRRVRRLYLPPYSPDLWPMERCLSQLTPVLRAVKARPREASTPDPNRPCNPSSPLMHGTGSSIVATRYLNMKTALAARELWNMPGWCVFHVPVKP